MELLRCFYQLFGLLFWRHPFTAHDPLVSKWCNAYFLQKQTYLHLSWMILGNFHFGWTTPLTLMYGSGSIWPVVIFELSEISVNLCFFFLKCCDFSSFRVMNMHAKFQHADVFWCPHFFSYHRTVPGSIWPAYFNALSQGSPYLVLEGRCPVEFSSNPNQTHLKQLIELFLDILETSKQVCWGKLELNSAGHWPSRTQCGDPCSKPNLQTQNNTISGYILLF